MRATPLVRRMSVVLGDDVIRARVAANLRSVSVLVLDSVIGAGEGDLAGGLHLDGIRGAGAVALGGGDCHAGNGGEGRGSCLDDGFIRVRGEHVDRGNREEWDRGDLAGAVARDSRNRGGSCGLGGGGRGGLGGGHSRGSLGLRGAAGAQGERGRSDESGGCQGASCDDHEPNRTGKYEGRTLFR